MISHVPPKCNGDLETGGGYCEFVIGTLDATSDSHCLEIKQVCEPCRDPVFLSLGGCITRYIYIYIYIYINLQAAASAADLLDASMLRCLDGCLRAAGYY